MPKQKRKARLKKNPEIADYVVERTYYTSGMRQEFSYYTKRSEARADAALSKADRVRIFRMRFTLVSDSKPAGRGRK